MDDFNWPPLFLFTSAVTKSKYERAEQEINIHKLYSLARKDFDKRISYFQFFDNKEDATKLANDELKHILIALKNLESYKSEERELLLEYRDYIIEKAKLDVVQEEFPQMFRSERAYNFFIRALKKFNAIDEKHNVLRGGQKVMNAIRKSKLYKKHILSQPLSLKSYIEGLNKMFGTKMCTTNLTTEDYSQKIDVDIYLEDYLKSSKKF